MWVKSLKVFRVKRGYDIPAMSLETDAEVSCSGNEIVRLADVCGHFVVIVRSTCEEENIMCNMQLTEIRIKQTKKNTILLNVIRVVQIEKSELLLRAAFRLLFVSMIFIFQQKK